MAYSYSRVQILGERDYQTECFRVISSAQSLFATIASSSRDTAVGRNSAILAAETFKDAYKTGIYRNITMESFFAQAMTKINKVLADNVYEYNTPPSIAAIIIERGFLNIAEMHSSLRGSSAFLFKNGNLIEVRNKIATSKVWVSRIKIKGDETIMLTSKGASNMLTEMEIINSLSQKGSPHLKCQTFEKIIRQKRYKDQDNATLLIVEESL